MASRGRLRALVFAGVFFVALLVAGLASVKSSNYKDVGQLKAYMEPVRGVNVKGYTDVFSPGVYRLVVGNTVFEFRVQQDSPYAVARRVYGPPFGSDDSYAVFILKSGSSDFRVVALFSAKTFTNLYGATPIMEEQVVVNGEYHPDLKAKLQVLHGDTPVTVAEYPVLIVNKILEGCHESYEQPSGRIA